MTMNETMKKIKDYLIHLLGGVTKEENWGTLKAAWELGHWYAYSMTYEYMKELYQTPAEEWCRKVWLFVKDNYENPSKLVLEQEKARHPHAEAQQADAGTEQPHTEA